jgi:Rad3-related DNA helicase
MDYLKEIQSTDNITSEHGTAIFSAFDCDVYEQETNLGFIYTAQNHNTKELYTLTKRKNPITEKDLPVLAEKIHHSPIVGYGRYQIDRPYGETLPIETAFEILNIYNSIEQIFNAIINQQTLILESQDGVTECLLPAIIIKRGRLNDFALSTVYGEMPIVIGTPNKPKIQKHIKSLSELLLDNGNVLTPLETDFYLCSHYGLFSAKLPDYQLLIIDEAHKFPQVARKVLTEAIDISKLAKLRFTNSEAVQTAKKLISESKRYVKDGEKRHLENLSDISERLLFQIGSNADLEHELKKFQILTDDKNLVWAENNKIICSPKYIGERLQELFWGKGKPTILTSNVLSNKGEFILFKKRMGLKDCLEIQNIQEQRLLLDFCDSLPFPNAQNSEYIEKLAAEIESLLDDDTIILFASYSLMKAVTERLNRENLPFHMFDSEIPTASSVVITKLPFLTPDTISRYEQSQYETYRREVLIPDMLIKLRRATLTADKVIILDSRKEYRKYITENLGGYYEYRGD